MQFNSTAKSYSYGAPAKSNTGLGIGLEASCTYTVKHPKP